MVSDGLQYSGYRTRGYIIGLWRAVVSAGVLARGYTCPSKQSFIDGEVWMSAEVEKKRLYWHSRRGMLELDVLLVPFLEEAYPSLDAEDRKSTRLNSSHVRISYAVFCLKKKKKENK